MKSLLLLLPLLLLQRGDSLNLSPPSRPPQLRRTSNEGTLGDPLRQLVRDRLAGYKHEMEASLSAFIPHHLNDNHDHNDDSYDDNDDDNDNYDIYDDNGNYDDNEKEGFSSGRQKRATITADNPQLLERRRRKIANAVAEKGTYVVTKSYRVSPHPFDLLTVLDLNSLLHDNHTLLFALERPTNQPTQVCVYKVNSGLSLEELWRLEVPGAILLEVVEISKTFYVLPLVPTTVETHGDIDVGSNLYRVDFHSRSFHKVQTINTPHARSCAFWKGSGEEANDVFLAVAPEFRESSYGERTMRVEVRVFRWQGGYFDYVSSVPASNPQSISFFNINSVDFLVTSNFGDDTGSTGVHSEIFRYTHKDARFLSFQRIRTSGAKDIKHFSFLNGHTHEHFLAVANNCETDEYGNKNYNVKSFIMKLTLRRFILFKSFATYGALQFLPVTLGEKFLLVLADMKGLRIFQYNGWSFVQTYNDPLPNLGHPITSIRLRPLTFQQQPFYTVSSNATNFQSGIYSVQMSLKDDYTKMTADLEKWCLAAKTQVDSVDFNEFTRRFHAAPKTTHETLSFKYPLTFSGDLRVNTLQAKSLEYNGMTFNSPLRDSLISQGHQSADLKKKVDEAVEEMKNVAFYDGINSFTGPVQVNGSVYSSHPSINANHLQVNDTLNGYHLQSLLPDILLRHLDYSHAKLHANHVKITGEFHPRKVNGVDVGDFALLDAPSATFTAKNTFFEELTVASELSVVDGIFGGVDFSHPPNFLLSKGNQSFPEIAVAHSHAAHLHTKFVNGHDVNYFYGDAVRLDDDVELTGAKEWGDVIVGGDLSLEGLLNGRDLTWVISSALSTHKDSQRMTGSSHFEDVRTEVVDLPGGPQVNGVNLLRDLVSTDASLPPQHFASIEVQEDAAVDSLTVSKGLNHIRVLPDNQLDLLLRHSSPQSLKSKTFVEDISVARDVVGEGLVDGVDLLRWNGSRRILLEKTTFKEEVVINGHLTTPHKLTVRKKFGEGGREILGVLRYASPLSASRLYSSCAIHFASLRVEGNTLVRKTLNGHKPLDSWLRRDGRQNYNVSGVTWIEGDVHLQQHVHSSGLYAAEGSPRNLLQVLPHLLIDGAEQSIPGDVEFRHTLRVGEASCGDTILEGGVPFSALLLLTNTPQTISVPSTFKGDVHAEENVDISGDILSVSFVNGVDLRSTIEDTLLKTSKVTQVIQGEWRVDADVEASEVETDGYVNNVDFLKLLRSLVLTNHSGPLSLYAESFLLEAASEVSSIQLDSSSTLNHLPHWGSNSHWLLNTGDQTVATPLLFSEGTFKVDSPLTSPHSSTVDVEGHEYPVDIAELDRNVIRRHLGGTLRGTTVFEDELLVGTKLDLGPSALVNGRDLRYSAVLRNRTSPLLVDSPYVFPHGMETYGNLLLQGKVDNVDINPAIQFLYPNSSSPTNESLIVHGNLLLKVEPYIRRTVNGFNLHELLDNVWFTDTHAILPNSVAFDNVIFKGNTPILVGPPEAPLLIAAVDVRDIEDKYASKVNDQVWTGNVTFGSATFKMLSTKTMTIDDALFNGIDVENLATSILLNGTDQQLQGSWEFSKLYARVISSVAGDISVNGMNVIEDFLRLHAPYGNKVTGLKTFTEELDVEELLLLHNDSTSIGGIDVEEWSSGSVKTHGDHVFQGPLNLHDFYGNLRVGGLVDGVQVDKESLLLRRGPQRIPGRMVVDLPEGLPPHTAALTAPHGIYVNGLFNEYNLNDTFGHLVRKSGEEALVIHGEKRFVSPIVVTAVSTAALFHGRNLSQLFGDFYSGLAIPHDLHFRANDKYSLLRHFTHQLSLAQGNAVFLEFFVLTQQLTHSPGKVTYVEILFGLKDLTLAVGVEDSSATTDTRWTFDLPSGLYTLSPLHSLRIAGQVGAYKEIDNEEGNFIVVSARSANNRRSPQLPTHIQKTPSFVETNKGGRSKVFILKEERSGESSRVLLTQTISATSFGAVQTFEDSSGPLSACLLLSPSDAHALILCPSPHFTPLHTFPLTNVSHTTSMEGLGRTFLILVEGAVAEVWSYSDSSHKWKRSSCIPLLSSPRSIDSIFGSNHLPFFAAASSSSVAIYKYNIEFDRFHKTQTIPVPAAPLHLKFLRTKPSAEVFLFVLTESPPANLLVYKYKGLGGWSLEHKWTTQPDAYLLQIFDFTVDDSHYLTQIVVSSSNTSRIYSATFKGLPPSRAEPPTPSPYY